MRGLNVDTDFEVLTEMKALRINELFSRTFIKKIKYQVLGTTA